MITIFRDKPFMKHMVNLVFPIAMQQLISSSLNLVDTVMIGALGEKSISAVGMANQIYFLLILFLFGISSGVGVYIAQYWGKGDSKSIHKAMWLSVLSGVAVSLPFFIGGFFYPSALLSVFSKEASVVQEGAIYLQITSISYLIMSVSLSFAIGSRNVGRAKIPMVASIVSLVFNTVFNYLLIFGAAGFPAMGVAGAAWATTGARVLELAIMLWAVYGNPHPLRVGLKDLKSITKEFVKPIIKTGLPVFLNEGFWAIGMTLYGIAYAWSGTNNYAAVQIASTVERLFFIFSFGLGSACAVMVGNSLGANRIDEAKEYANRFLKLGVLASLILGAVMAGIAYPSTLLFNVTPAIRESAIAILLVYAVTHILKMITTLLVIGIFRGGGDTTFSFCLEIFCVYLIGVPMAFLGALYFKWPIYYVILLVTVEELVKSLVGLKRVRSGIWARNLVGHGIQ